MKKSCGKQKKIIIFKEKIKNDEIQEGNIKKWVDRIEPYLTIEKLDRYITKELIDKINVSEFYKLNGKNTQDVIIYYKFVENLQNLIKGEIEIAV